MYKQGDIKEHMKVIAKDGAIFATVDHLEGGTNTIKLTRDKKTGAHHWIPLEWVKKVDAKGVHIDKPADEAEKKWQESPPSVPH